MQDSGSQQLQIAPPSDMRRSRSRWYRDVQSSPRFHAVVTWAKSLQQRTRKHSKHIPVPSPVVEMHWHLPAELWIYIGSLLDMGDSRALAKTCHWIRHILTPLIYREIMIRVHDVPQADQQGCTAWQPYHERIQFYTSIASLPRSVHLGCTQVPLTGPTMDLANVLLDFANLTALHLRDLHLDELVLALINKLTGLKVLGLLSCFSSIDLDFSVLELMEINVMSSCLSRSIILNPDYIEEITCDALNLPKIMPTTGFNYLRTLRTSDSEKASQPNRIMDVIISHDFPSLEALMIHYASDTPRSEPFFHPDFPFNLKCYRGPLDYFSMLVHDYSQLEDVTLWNFRSGYGEHISSTLRYLSLQAPMLRRLEIYIYGHHMEHDIRGFDNLEELYLNLSLNPYTLQAEVSEIAQWMLPSNITMCVFRLGHHIDASSLDFSQVERLMMQHPNLGYARVIVWSFPTAPDPLVQCDFICVRGDDGEFENRFRRGGLVEEDPSPWMLLWTMECKKVTGSLTNGPPYTLQIMSVLSGHCTNLENDGQAMHHHSLLF